jgi:hypothetical protein
MAPPTHFLVGTAIRKWFWMAFNFETEQWISETFIRVNAGTRYLKKSYSAHPSLLQLQEETLRDGRTLLRPFTVSQIAIYGGDTACVVALFLDWCARSPNALSANTLQFVEPEQRLTTQTLDLLGRQALGEGVDYPHAWDREVSWQLPRRLEEIHFAALAHVVEAHSTKEWLQ